MGSLFSLKTFIVDFVYVFMYFLHTFHFHPYQIIEKNNIMQKNCHIYFFAMLGLWFNVPVNSFGRLGMVI